MTSAVILKLGAVDDSEQYFCIEDRDCVLVGRINMMGSCHDTSELVG